MRVVTLRERGGVADESNILKPSVREVSITDKKRAIKMMLETWT